MEKINLDDLAEKVEKYSKENDMEFKDMWLDACSWAELFKVKDEDEDIEGLWSDNKALVENKINLLSKEELVVMLMSRYIHKVIFSVKIDEAMKPQDSLDEIKEKLLEEIDSIKTFNENVHKLARF